MGRLFADVEIHHPIAAPSQADIFSMIHTHSVLPSFSATGSATTARASTLYDTLFAAWQAKDWVALVAAAKAHLIASGPEPSLHPITEAAIAFFSGKTAIGPGDTERFLLSIPAVDLAAYLAGPTDADRDRLADDALALHCLGMLGGAPFDYVGALRAIQALRVGVGLWNHGKSRPLDPGLIARLIDFDVALPPWSFEIDPCQASPSGEAWVQGNPLETKLYRLEQAGLPAGPEACNCSPPPAACLPPDPCCAKVNYYVADLLELRDWVYRYKASDIAYIEVVAPVETRTREHRFKRTRDLYSETETSQRTSETRDLQVSERSSLQKEIERQREQSLSGEASATASYNAKPYSLTASASVSFSRSSSEALRDAQEKAVETVRKAVSEIEKQTRVKQTERVTTEESEKNLHAFVNRSGQPLVTQYFYVTQERRAQLFSYGKQMIAEFIVPEPARLYEELMKRRRDIKIARQLGIPPEKGDPPAPPAPLELVTDGLTPLKELGFDADSMELDNYAERCAKWGVTPPPEPPAATGTISVAITDQNDHQDGSRVGDYPFQVPPEYEAVSMTLTGPEANWVRPNKSPHKVEFNCAGSGLFWSDDKHQADSTQTSLNHLTGSQSISCDAWHTDFISNTIVIELHLLPSVMTAWRQSVFQPIKDKYDALVAAHHEAIAAFDAAAVAKSTEYDAARAKLEQELMASETVRHPFFNTEIMRAELKRSVIYLMCQDFSVDGAMIRAAKPCGLPEIDRGRAAERGYDWYFWDRLIDWKLMAYAFFDYFWNPMCDWPQRFDPDEPDAMFKAFRRAGYARVLVPVSAAMQRDFAWYVKTHQKWGPGGKPAIDPSDPRWRNVVFEMEHANASAMTAREGHAEVHTGSPLVTIKGSDRYWTPVTPPPVSSGAVNQVAIELDIDREIFLDGEVYLITAIAPAAGGSPHYDPLHPNRMWWNVTLDRPYAGPSGSRLYAVGAKAVAPVFSFDLPTELIWAGENNKCLPTYPLPGCVAPRCIWPFRWG
jgi:hypothetical protein